MVVAILGLWVSADVPPPDSYPGPRGGLLLALAVVVLVALVAVALYRRARARKEDA